MKSLIFILFLSVACEGFVINVPTVSPVFGNGRLDWILRQKQVLSLFKYACDISEDPHVVSEAQTFSNEFSEANFADEDVIVRFKNLKLKGFLSRDELYTEYNTEHLEEYKIVRDLLFSAKDFNTFFTTAAWARQNLNCELFIDAFYSALLLRTDTSKLYIPPPYEILPNYFIKKSAFISAHFLLSNKFYIYEEVQNEGNSYVFNVNYTSNFDDDFNKLAYFHEDVGLNALVYFKKLIIDNRFDTKEIDQADVAEKIYYLMKQLATRYELEKYSNNVYDNTKIDWNRPNIDLYDPMLIHIDGTDLSGRTKDFNLVGVEDQIDFLRSIEDNIPAIMSRMVQNEFSKKEIIRSLVEVLVTGDNSYESIAFRALGKNFQATNKTPTKEAPSILDHYMTLCRDPMFWKINSKIVSIIENALTTLPAYSRNDVFFPGVRINNAEIKKVMTSFDQFEIDTIDALKPASSDITFNVKFSQPRLNHKPFSLKLNVTSLIGQKGFIKVFLGPKILPGDLVMKKHQFMLIDAFQVSLKLGVNTIKRQSSEMTSFTDDFVSISSLYKNIEDAEFGLNTLSFENKRRYTELPSHLAMPKGSESGLPFQLFVFIAPLTKITVTDSYLKQMEYNRAVLSPGYPLDFDVEGGNLFDLPNAMVKEITIVHKSSSVASDTEDYNKPYNKPDYSNGYQRPSPYKKPFDSDYAASNYLEQKTFSNFDVKNRDPKSVSKSKWEIKDKKTTEEKTKFNAKVSKLNDERFEVIETPNTPIRISDPKMYLLDNNQILETFVIDPKHYEIEEKPSTKNKYTDATRTVTTTEVNTLAYESSYILEPHLESVFGGKKDINIGSKKVSVDSDFNTDKSFNFNNKKDINIGGKKVSVDSDFNGKIDKTFDFNNNKDINFSKNVNTDYNNQIDKSFNVKNKKDINMGGKKVSVDSDFKSQIGGGYSFNNVKDINVGDKKVTVESDFKNPINKSFNYNKDIDIGGKKVSVDSDYNGIIDKTFDYNKDKDINFSKNINTDYNNQIDKSFNVKNKKDINIDGKKVLVDSDYNGKIDKTFDYNKDKDINFSKNINTDYNNQIDKSFNVKNKKDINMGGKKVSVDSDYNGKIDKTFDYNKNTDMNFSKNINTDTSMNKYVDKDVKVTDKSFDSDLYLTKSKDFTPDNFSDDIHKKIFIDANDLDSGNINSNADISITKDDGTEIDIHRILDNAKELQFIIDYMKPRVNYVSKQTNSDDDYEDYKVYE